MVLPSSEKSVLETPRTVVVLSVPSMSQEAITLGVCVDSGDEEAASDGSVLSVRVSSAPGSFSSLYPCHARDGDSAEDSKQLPDMLPVEFPLSDKRVPCKSEGPNPPGDTSLPNHSLTSPFKESHLYAHSSKLSVKLHSL